MKIAFWSNENEKCNVSANLAAVSIASVIRYPYTVIVIENRLNSRGIGRAYSGNYHTGPYYEVGTNYYDGGGIEGLLRKIYRGYDCSEVLKSHLKEIIHDHLYYIPQSRVIHNELFEYEFDRCIFTLFELMEKYADISLIDTASQKNLSTKTILEEADLIVVNLCQTQDVLEDFFRNHSSMMSKAVIMISDYDCHSILNIRRIAKTYQILRENILVIPKSTSYKNAYTSGSVVEFMKSNYSCFREDPNYLFIQSMKKAACTIIKRAQYKVKEKEMIMCKRQH